MPTRELPRVNLNNCRRLFGVVSITSFATGIWLSNSDGRSSRRAVQDNICVLWWVGCEVIKLSVQCDHVYLIVSMPPKKTVLKN